MQKEDFLEQQKGAVRLSREFLIRLKLHTLPAYKIAQLAGVNPGTLSKLVNGIEQTRFDDARIWKVAQILGLNASEVFDKGE